MADSQAIGTVSSTTTAHEQITNTSGADLEKETAQAQTEDQILVQTCAAMVNNPHESASQISGFTASPITPPLGTGVPGQNKCIVDYNHQPYSMTWSGSPHEYPDLERFPHLENVEVSLINQNPTIAAIWRDSELLDYGTHASVRIAESDLFPILKFAHHDKLSIHLIAHEFDVLAALKKKGLSVVDFDPQPIMDSGTFCGYRMEKLFRVELDEFRSRIDDIKYELDRFHSASFSHGDFSPSNVMKDKNGHIVLTDASCWEVRCLHFSRAGAV
ncbi:Protein kinase-like (PK-like) [Glarea lozoyensis ATCC 20868]|uniref:Protein kinase-like (PK-like) n=1 Tax=Glarea lozoyensis (strain ATCC 20868 / MF5171) TaxID=1116229 RepID=S3D179_GLAL2|nr:Protein kinase-like (PK-like) [Glarea lozoyensis ATCC 20868]EPE30909.1 Protein kinase-like (PK-like) [Glarea lozoyensis ATCC 20868]